ncbi:MAG: hypothetical protein OEZ34_04020 [Spirochaetia bacterium]|nr:hypothetical protein [Spirochaetia bacterium]
MIPLVLDVKNLSDFFMYFVKENQMLVPSENTTGPFMKKAKL